MVADLELTFAISPYDRVMPLITGEVKPDGITLRYFPVSGPDIFYQQLKFQRFDVSEMSFSSFLMARAKDWPYRALPVFHNRQFEYTKLLIRKDAGIKRPEDLKGKRVSTSDYQQTPALWIRGQLQHEFGVRPQDMVWYQARSQRFSHGGAVGFKTPPGVELHYATTSVGTMLLRKELDASHYQFHSSMDRGNPDLSNHPNFRWLFPDRMKEATRYFKKNSFFPAHHLTAVRESVLKEHPWVANSLLDALNRAKDLARERLYQHPPSLLLFGSHYVALQRDVFGDDPFAYGIRANARVIDTVQTYSVEQGLTQRKQPWDELFAEEVLLAEEGKGPLLPAATNGSKAV